MVWKDAVIALADSPNLEGVDLTPALELFTYLNETIAARRKDPGEDILSQLITGEEALNDQDAIGLSFLFVLAGLDTVTASIGFALHELARDPWWPIPSGSPSSWRRSCGWSLPHRSSRVSPPRR
jgi:hypothetical protein